MLHFISADKSAPSWTRFNIVLLRFLKMLVVQLAFPVAAPFPAAGYERVIHGVAAADYSGPVLGSVRVFVRVGWAYVSARRDIVRIYLWIYIDSSTASVIRHCVGSVYKSVAKCGRVVHAHRGAVQIIERLVYVRLETVDYFHPLDRELHQKQLLKYIHEMELSEIVQAVNRITAYKLEITDYLDIIMIWYRDVLLYKATKDMDKVVFKEQISYIKEQAKKSSYEGIETILKALDTAKSRLRANVNFDLVMELLFLTIKEN